MPSFSAWAATDILHRSFPAATDLSDAISPEQPALVLPMHAEGAGEPRLTLTLPVIVKARFVALHIEGAGKKAVLEEALGRWRDDGYADPRGAAIRADRA